MPLIFENPDDITEPLFDRLQAAATGNTPEGGSVRIAGGPDIFRAVINFRPDGKQWNATGTADAIVQNFKTWLRSEAP